MYWAMQIENIFIIMESSIGQLFKSCLNVLPTITSRPFSILLIFKCPLKSHPLCEAFFDAPLETTSNGIFLIPLLLCLLIVLVVYMVISSIWMLEMWEKEFYVLIFISSSQFLNDNNAFWINEWFGIEEKVPNFNFIFYFSKGGKKMFYNIFVFHRR